MNENTPLHQIFFGQDAGEYLPASFMMDEPEPVDFQLCTKMVLSDHDYIIPGENYRMTQVAGKSALFVGKELAALGKEAEKLRYVLSPEWVAIHKRTGWREDTPSIAAAKGRAQYFEHLERVVDEGMKFLENDTDYSTEMDRRYHGDFTYSTITESIDHALFQLYPEPGQWEYQSTAELTLADAL